MYWPMYWPPPRCEPTLCGSTGVANLPEGDAKAVAKIKLVLHSWRDNEKLTDCGTVLKKTTTEGGDDSRKAQQLDGVTVHFLNLRSPEAGLRSFGAPSG